MKNIRTFFSICLAPIFISATGVVACSRTHEESGRKEPLDPARCQQLDLGDAEDYSDKNFPDDRLITIGGISHPTILVWRDARAGRVFYVTRVSGTRARLLYMAELAPGQTPTARTSFSGTIRKWKQLSEDLTRPMSAAIRNQWDVHIDADNTWVISADGKPDGCP